MQRSTDKSPPNPFFEASLKALDAIYARRMRLALAEKENIPGPAPDPRSQDTRGEEEHVWSGCIPRPAPENQDTQQKRAGPAAPTSGEENIPSPAPDTTEMLRSSLRCLSPELQSCAPRSDARPKSVSFHKDLEAVCIIPGRNLDCHWLIEFKQQVATRDRVRVHGGEAPLDLRPRQGGIGRGAR
ncbi:hypothetical protein T484DRAFT_1745256 [Baffinella frigidus]|nr:hypothetical protein T484DRAFT_1745256 [Cryptophyta sp. CCMP2293]